MKKLIFLTTLVIAGCTPKENTDNSKIDKNDPNQTNVSEIKKEEVKRTVQTYILENKSPVWIAIGDTKKHGSKTLAVLGPNGCGQVNTDKEEIHLFKYKFFPNGTKSYIFLSSQSLDINPQYYIISSKEDKDFKLEIVTNKADQVCPGF